MVDGPAAAWAAGRARLRRRPTVYQCPGRAARCGMPATVRAPVRRQGGTRRTRACSPTGGRVRTPCRRRRTTATSRRWPGSPTAARCGARTRARSRCHAVKSSRSAQCHGGRTTRRQESAACPSRRAQPRFRPGPQRQLRTPATVRPSRLAGSRGAAGRSRARRNTRHWTRCRRPAWWSTVYGPRRGPVVRQKVCAATFSTSSCRGRCLRPRFVRSPANLS